MPHETFAVISTEVYICGIQGNTTVQISSANDAPSTELMPPATTAAAVPQIALHNWCGQYAISSHSFSKETVGAKSLNILKLKVQCVHDILCHILAWQNSCSCASVHAMGCCAKRFETGPCLPQTQGVYSVKTACKRIQLSFCFAYSETCSRVTCFNSRSRFNLHGSSNVSLISTVCLSLSSSAV